MTIMAVKVAKAIAARTILKMPCNLFLAWMLPAPQHIPANATKNPRMAIAK